MTNFWPAPLATSHISHTQPIPGSKSLTNRVFILSALADRDSIIHRPLYSRDTELMADALSAMGVKVVQEPNHLTIRPGALHGATIDCGLAGTVLRFLPPLAALADGPVTVTGDEQAKSRPIAPLLKALRQLGLEIEGDTIPFTINSDRVPAGGVVEVDASGSSQFISGLLLSAPRYENGITVRHTGQTLPSMPHIEMTVEMLRNAGVTVDTDTNEWRVHPGPIHGGAWTIEPDMSNATPFLAAASVTGGTMTIPQWSHNTTQPGDAIREILDEMGCEVGFATEDASGQATAVNPAFGDLTVTGPPIGQLNGIDKNMSDIGELTPTVAAMAALANSPSRLTGIGHLRGHETDRLAALSTEINRLGGQCEILDDGLLITPAELHGGQWHTYHDHRMATAGAIIGLRISGVEVENIATTSKTLPDFATLWESMVIAAENPAWHSTDEQKDSDEDEDSSQKDD